MACLMMCGLLKRSDVGLNEYWILVELSGTA